jgi:hypothetical protein
MALINVPLAGESLGQTRVPIQTNFITIGTAFAIDHVDYNTAGQGKHNKVTLPVQAVDPVLVANDIAIYSKVNGANVSQLFFERAGGAPYTWTDSLQAVNGWTRLPSGILLKWGTQAIVAPGGQVNIVYVGPAFTQIYSAQVSCLDATLGDSNCAVRIMSYNNLAGLQIYASQRTIWPSSGFNFSVTYLTIGV